MANEFGPEFFPADAVPLKPVAEISEARAQELRAREFAHEPDGRGVWEPSEVDVEYFQARASGGPITDKWQIRR